eukprot:scaffold22379_cov145-Isochrysis_galbana.AAC.7
MERSTVTASELARSYRGAQDSVMENTDLVAQLLRHTQCPTGLLAMAAAGTACVPKWAEWAREGCPVAPTGEDLQCLRAVGGYDGLLCSMTLRLDPVQSTDRRYPNFVELIRGNDRWYIEVRVGNVTMVRGTLTLKFIHMWFTNRNCTFVQMEGPGSPEAIDHIIGTILTLVRQGILDFSRVGRRVAHSLGLQHSHRGVFNFRRRFPVIDGWFEASVHTTDGGRYVYTRCPRGTEC